MRRLISSPIGPITLLANNEQITGLYFGDQQKEHASGADNTELMRLCEKELNDYFEGKLQNFTVPICAKGTAFREEVWEALKRIPYGETVSYKDIAVMLGKPKALRAVGGANHNNPISIIIPCHRVVGADGSLTGYGGGLKAKQWLLDLEAKYRGGR